MVGRGDRASDAAPWVATAAVALALLGVVAAVVECGLDSPLLWMPQALAAAALAAAGADAWRRDAGTGALLLAAALAWSAATLFPIGLYWHRGVLIHAILAYPGIRPRTWYATVVIAAGYVSALVPWAWTNPVTTVVLCTGVVGAAVGEAVRRRARPWRRRAPLVAATLFAAATCAVPLVVAVVPRSGGVVLSLLAYEAAVIAVAVILAAALRAREPERVADLVVELGDDTGSSEA